MLLRIFNTSPFLLSLILLTRLFSHPNLGIKEIVLIAANRENNNTANKNERIISKKGKVFFNQYLSAGICDVNSHINPLLRATRGARRLFVVRGTL